MDKDPKDMTVHEFMNWLLEEYPNTQKVLPSDYYRSIDFLEGYAMAKRDKPEGIRLENAVDCLRQAAKFFEILRRYWKVEV